MLNGPAEQKSQAVERDINLVITMLLKREMFRGSKRPTLVMEWRNSKRARCHAKDIFEALDQNDNQIMSLRRSP